MEPCLKMRHGGLGGARAPCSARGSSLAIALFLGRGSDPPRRGWHAEGFKIMLMSLTPLLASSTQRI